MKTQFAFNNMVFNPKSKESKLSLVQCPACQTKFAVETKLIDAVDMPRFHCSRCDHIFNIEETAVKSLATDEPKEEIKIDSPPITSPAADTKTKEQMAFSFGGQKSIAPQELDDEFYDEMPETGVDVFDPDIDSIDEEFVDDDELRQSKDILKSIDEIHNFSKDSELGSDVEIDPWDALPKREPLPEKTRSRIKFLPSLSGTYSVVAPLFFFLVILAGTSILIMSKSSLGISIADFLSSNAPAPAPTDLFIKDTKLKTLSLDSNETIDVLSGTLVNNTSRTFDDIEIAGYLFDSNGKTLINTNMSLSSPLAKARLRSLSLSMIQNLQGSRMPRRFMLRPGEETEFTLPLLNGKTDSGAFYSVSIYSALSN